MSDIVSISELKVEMSVGAYEWEKTLRQTVSIDVDMICDTRAAGLSDNLDDALDYAKAADLITQLSASRHFLLLESFAEEIAERLLAQTRTQQVRIKVSKPGAIPAAKSVSVTIERQA